MLKGTNLETNMGEQEIDAIEYKQVVGKLVYLTNFKPNIVYEINVVNRFMARPHKTLYVGTKTNFEIFARKFGLWHNLLKE